MNALYLVGGQQKYLRPLFTNDSDWYEYDKGVVLKLDLDTGHSQLVVEYKSPCLSHNGTTTATLFKSGNIDHDTFYLCTQTEVLLYQLPGFKQISYISLPCFNDVHHVRPTPQGTLVVASSGLDMVLEITRDGKNIREWSALNEEPWTRFSRDVDYRMINTKPHKAHPNFLFYVDDELWSTRFYQRDAICIADPSRRIQIGLGAPHDGLQYGDYIFFTTVNGHVVIVDKRTLRVDETIDLNAIHENGSPLGWCRGVLIEDEKMWVGFSRIRPTRLRENVEWAKRLMKSHLRSLLPSHQDNREKWLKREQPSHIACYDLKRRKCLTEMNIEEHGISALFSIFRARKEAAQLAELPGAASAPSIAAAG